MSKFKPNIKEPGIPGLILHSLDKDEVPLLVDTNLPELESRYLKWLKSDVYASYKVTLEQEAKNALNETHIEKSVRGLKLRVPKRGNKEYILALTARLQAYIDRIPKTEFFTPARGRTHYRTPCLYIVLTINPKEVKNSRYYAWDNIYKQLNRFMAGFRRTFKLNSVIRVRSWECFYQKALGYPHVNLLIYCDKPFNVKRHISRKPGKDGRKKVTFRLANYNTKQKIDDLWKWGFTDIQGVSRIGGTQHEEAISSIYGEESSTHIHKSVYSFTHATKYLTKNIRDETCSQKTITLNAILWAMRKRTFSLGNFFGSGVKGSLQLWIRQQIESDLTRSMSNKNRTCKITIEFQGIVPDCISKCCKSGKPPPDSCPYLTENRENGLLLGLCPHNKDLEAVREAKKQTNYSGSFATESSTLTSSNCRICGTYFIHNKHEIHSTCERCALEDSIRVGG